MRETLTLQEAARFLKLSPEALRRKAKAGVIPGGKAGKRWCFYEPDLVDYLRSRYARPRQASQSGKEVASCHSIDVIPSGGSGSRPPAESEYAALLGLPTRKKPRNTTTASKRKSGKPNS
ncbi:MAG: helix-turn-helix domain-containing protein [Proteobacteria bacterium]|nr:helix-turn-helix domain-containing protein [Pseudomonadota bacterium]